MISVFYQILGELPEGVDPAVIEGACSLIGVLTAVFVDRIFRIFDAFSGR